MSWFQTPTRPYFPYEWEWKFFQGYRELWKLVTVWGESLLVQAPVEVRVTGPLRFGVVLITEDCSRAEWMTKCRWAEALGYDVIAVPDHLNLLSPFPSAMLAAEATDPRASTTANISPSTISAK